MKVIKRDGTEVNYDPQKIFNAVRKANKDIPEVAHISEAKINVVVDEVNNYVSKLSRSVHVEEIQDEVVLNIQKVGCYQAATAYSIYRYKHELKRKENSTDDLILSVIDNKNQEANEENSNKNPAIISTQRDYMAGYCSKDLSRRLLLPEEIIELHDAGVIHFHDMDYYAQRMHNCCLINIKDMLENGTVISKVMIERPNSIWTAANVTTQIVAQVASCQYGGQTWTLAHIAPFVDVSRQKWRRKVKSDFEEFHIDADEETINKIAEKHLHHEIETAIQTIQYQLITLQTTNGQAPFVSVVLNINEVPEGQTRDDLALLIEEMLNQRILGVKNRKGQNVPPAFPKLLYFLDDNNVAPDSKYYYLTRLSAICSIHRMVPDYISAKKMRELKGDVYPCMGCRSFLTVDRFTEKNLGNFMKAKDFVPGEHRYYGRFNQGVVTVNLVDIACYSKRNVKKFWERFDYVMNKAFEALMCRHNRLKGTKSDVAPIMWQDGAIARLEPGEVIDPLLYNGYSTISLGYAGLHEMTVYMTGMDHTSGEGHDFALEVMKALNDYTTKWKNQTNIDFSIYGTPLESTTYKFAKCLQQRWGYIEGVTTKNYITNSYHVNVLKQVDAFTKLKIESEFQELSPGGAISYVEVPNMRDNVEAVLSVITYIYDNTIYAELNTKLDHCLECGFEGEVELIRDADEKLIWRCPKCGNTDIHKLSVIRRTCGYIGTEEWNQGRLNEFEDRVLHL